MASTQPTGDQTPRREDTRQAQLKAPWTRERIQEVIVWAAGLLALVEQILVVLGKFDDPLWRLVAFGVSAAVSGYACWHVFARKGVRSPIQSVSGKPLNSKSLRAKPAIRALCVLLLVLTTAIFSAQLYRSFVAPTDIVRISGPIFVGDRPQMTSAAL
ncbi:MAG: hypothetical protein ACREJM_15890, partial [Candidatus Saccharimonadales bacterium]